MRPAPRRPPLRLLPPPSCAPGRRCLMLTLVDGTAVTQCMLHTMDVEPAEPILMDSHTPVRAPPSPRHATSREAGGLREPRLLRCGS